MNLILMIYFGGKEKKINFHLTVLIQLSSVALNKIPQ